jgi:hypothetical protein
MKVFLLIVLILSTGLFTACEKSASTTIEGRWNVISDSAIISGATTSYNVYYGNDADYFVFKKGILFTKESFQLDTFFYKTTSANSMRLSQTGVSINAAPETGTYIFTGNSVIIHITSNFITPGFYCQRIINLKR